MSTHLDGTPGGQPGTVASRLNPAAFAAEFQASARTLWCVAAGVLGRRQEADDVLQDAAMIALGKLEQFNVGTSFLAWMARIVRYVALNHARARSRFSALELDSKVHSTVDSDSPIPMPALTGRGELIGGQDLFDDRVLAALRGLDDTARACLLLRTVLELPYRQIALALDIPEGTAMSHVHRARAQMRLRLADHETNTKGAGSRT